MTVSELAKSASVTAQTVRFYEREGLLPQPDRDHSGYRNYDEKALRRLHFISEAKEIGFTLKQIRQLMGLNAASSQSCQCVQEMISERLVELESRLAAMRRMRKHLKELLQLCRSQPPDSACPVLKVY